VHINAHFLFNFETVYKYLSCVPGVDGKIHPVGSSAVYAVARFAEDKDQ